MSRVKVARSWLVFLCVRETDKITYLVSCRKEGYGREGDGGFIPKAESKEMLATTAIESVTSNLREIDTSH
jgi:hypothetical protein